MVGRIKDCIPILGFMGKVIYKCKMINFLSF